MVVGRNNGVFRLTEFSDKKMSGLLFGPQTSGRNNGVVVLTGWSYGGVALYIVSLFYQLEKTGSHIHIRLAEQSTPTWISQATLSVAVSYD